MMALRYTQTLHIQYYFATLLSIRAFIIRQGVIDYAALPERWFSEQKITKNGIQSVTISSINLIKRFKFFFILGNTIFLSIQFMTWLV